MTLSVAVLNNLAIKQVPSENTAKILLQKYKINKEKTFKEILSLEGKE
jgi:hypothetical protein